MVSWRKMSTPSGRKTDHIFMIPHSKNGICMNLGCVGKLGRAGQPDVGRGRAGWIARIWGAFDAPLSLQLMT